MTKKYSDDIHDYLSPFYINGLEGRMLKTNSKTKKQHQILYVYDLLDTLEESWGLIQNLRNYGIVTAVDLPGIGGMTSFNKIKHPINIDAFADYLAAFIKLRFKKHKIIAVGNGFGFVVITRMLIRYPSLSSKIKFIININGQIHYDDLLISSRFKKIQLNLFDVLSIFPFTHITKKLLQHKNFVSRLSNKFGPQYTQYLLNLKNPEALNYKSFFGSVDVKTFWKISKQLLTLDNCSKRINIPLKHAFIKNYGLINNSTQKQHMMITYKNYRCYEIKMIGDIKDSSKKQASLLLPKGLKRVLSSAKA